MHYRKRLTNLVEWRNHTEILYNALQEKINKTNNLKTNMILKAYQFTATKLTTATVLTI